MITLVIPDIHENEPFRDKVTQLAEDADRVVCLGDYFDAWAGVIQATDNTIEWVKEKLDDPKWTLLLGNHDMHYLYEHPQLRCSGYAWQRAQKIMQAGITELRDRFKLFDWAGEWFLSHAGFPVFPSLSREQLLAEASLALRSAAQVSGTLHPYLVAGESRGGFASRGGVTWADFSEHRNLLEPDGSLQIIGHTHMREPQRLFEYHPHATDPEQELQTIRHFIDTEAHVAWIDDAKGSIVIERVLPAETQRNH